MSKLTTHIKKHLRVVHWHVAPPTSPRSSTASHIPRSTRRTSSASHTPSFPKSSRRSEETTIESDVETLARYITPQIGPTRLDALRLEDFERVMSAVPADKSSTTRRHIGQTCAAIMSYAVYPAKHITASPIPPEKWVTDRTGHRLSQMLARYTRQAREWAELGLGEVGEMHRLIPEIAAELPAESHPNPTPPRAQNAPPKGPALTAFGR